MRPTFKRERSVGRGETDAADDDGYELQCLDCYAIFEADAPPGRAACDACGSSNTAAW